MNNEAKSKARVDGARVIDHREFVRGAKAKNSVEAQAQVEPCHETPQAEEPKADAVRDPRDLATQLRDTFVLPTGLRHRLANGT